MLALKQGIYTVCIIAISVSSTLSAPPDRTVIPNPPAPWIELNEPPTRNLSKHQAEAILEKDWLFQTEGIDLKERTKQEINWTLLIAERLTEQHPQLDLDREIADLIKLSREPDFSKATDIYLSVRRIKRNIFFKNPVINFSRVMFIDIPYPQGQEWAHEARHRNGVMAVPGGRLLILEGLHPDGKVTKLAPEKPGSFWRPDLSFDGKKVLFCFKPHDEKSFHLY